MSYVNDGMPPTGYQLSVSVKRIDSRRPYDSTTTVYILISSEDVIHRPGMLELYKFDKNQFLKVCITSTRKTACTDTSLIVTERFQSISVE